jgi:hypothetical protein
MEDDVLAQDDRGRASVSESQQVVPLTAPCASCALLGCVGAQVHIVEQGTQAGTKEGRRSVASGTDSRFVAVSRHKRRPRM